MSHMGDKKCFCLRCKTSPESHCCLTESTRCTGRAGCGLWASWCPRTGEISQVLSDLWGQISHCNHISQLAWCKIAQKHPLNWLRAPEEATIRKRRWPIRETCDNHAMYTWASLCWWVYECFSEMMLCWSHPSGMDPPGIHCILVDRLP